MADHLWVSLGAMPGGADIVVLSMKPDKEEARLAMKQNALVSFDRPAVTTFFDLNTTRRLALHAKLKAYFKRLGFRECELDSLLDKILKELAMGLLKAKQS